MALLTSSDVESFRNDLTATFRALLGNDEAKVTFSLVPAFASNVEADYQQADGTLTFRFPTTDLGLYVDEVRGLADQQAAQLRYHDSELDSLLRPADGLTMQQQWFDVLERTRTDLVAGDWYKGVKTNLFHVWQSTIYHALKEQQTDLLPPQELLALALYLHQTGHTLSAEMQKIAPLMEHILQLLPSGDFEALLETVHDQEAFSRRATKIINHLVENPPHNPELSDNHEEQPTSMNSDVGDEQEDMQVPSSFDDEQGETEEQEVSSQTIQSLMDDVDQQTSEEHSSTAADDVLSRQHEEETFKDTRPVTMLYHAYTTEHDEIIRPLDIATPEELLRYRKQLDSRLDELRDVSHRLARKLQRQLMAQQLRSWDFNMEEGMLDSAKLATLITDPTYAYPFKWERKIEEKNTVISILLDNSGSMRGRPITIAALCADILIRTLERCNISTELLGFTTAEWKGGKSKKDWLNAGSPALPGRLNDLRHIIYKDAHSSWRKSRNHLGLMLKEGILKENIDGEAILWAYDRLLSHAEERKILMVISDGAPVDDSTLSANAGQYILDRHLRDVIQTVEKQQHVELMAIGIGHQVDNLYSRAITINQVDELGEAMVTHLTQLFEKKSAVHPLRAKTL